MSEMEATRHPMPENEALELFERYGRGIKSSVSGGFSSSAIRVLADSYVYDLLVYGWPTYAWSLADLTEDLIKKGTK